MASSCTATAGQELDQVRPQNTCSVHATAAPGGLSPRLVWPISVSLEGYCGAEGRKLAPCLCHVPPGALCVLHSHGGPCVLHSKPSASQSPCFPTARRPAGRVRSTSRVSQIHLFHPFPWLPPRPPSSLTWPQCLSSVLLAARVSSWTAATLFTSYPAGSLVLGAGCLLYGVHALCHLTTSRPLPCIHPLRLPRPPLPLLLPLAPTVTPGVPSEPQPPGPPPLRSLPYGSAPWGNRAGLRCPDWVLLEWTKRNDSSFTRMSLSQGSECLGGQLCFCVVPRACRWPLF